MTSGARLHVPHLCSPDPGWFPPAGVRPWLPRPSQACATSHALEPQQKDARAHTNGWRNSPLHPSSVDHPATTFSTGTSGKGPTAALIASTVLVACAQAESAQRVCMRGKQTSTSLSKTPRVWPRIRARHMRINPCRATVHLRGKVYLPGVQGHASGSRSLSPNGIEPQVDPGQQGPNLGQGANEVHCHSTIATTRHTHEGRPRPQMSALETTLTVPAPPTPLPQCCCGCQGPTA